MLWELLATVSYPPFIAVLLGLILLYMAYRIVVCGQPEPPKE